MRVAGWSTRTCLMYRTHGGRFFGYTELLPSFPLLVAAMLGHALPFSLRAGAAQAAKPNIVFLLADDMGYGDLARQNPASKIRTPNLDRLASQGMRFTDAHAPSALCTPTRYSILTGQYCWRSRLKTGVMEMWDEPLIPPERLTVSGLLRDNGYRTACFGKWHLGMTWPFLRTVPPGFDARVAPWDIDWRKRIAGGPVDRGFDYYFGVNTANDPPYAFIENDHVRGWPNTRYPTVTGEQSHWAGPGVASWDWHQVMPTVTSNAVRWIQQCSASNTPFFAYFALTGPHQPIVPNAGFLGTSQAGIYGDFVQELDNAVGQVLRCLDASGAATNTLVIFTSDNGPDEFTYQRIQDYGHSSVGSLRGIKRDIWEGGHRVPFLARWPGKIVPGSISGQTICLSDFMRTAADIVGAAIPTNAAEDSISFLPILLGGGTPTRRPLILESACGQFGIRSNNWMYIDSYTGDGHNPELEPLWFKKSRGYAEINTWPALLYDLQKDPTEAFNVYAQQTALVGQLLGELQLCRAEVAWLGAHSAMWTHSANWSPTVCPASSDVVYSNNSPAAGYAQGLGANFRVNTITLASGLTSYVSIAPGGPFHLSLLNGIDMAKADADLLLEADLVLEQSQVWHVGTNRMLTATGGIALNGRQLMICGAGNVTLAGAVSGEGGLLVRNGGFVSLGGTNTFTGGIEISGGGFVAVQHDRALGAGPVIIPNNSTLELRPGVAVTNATIITGFGRLWQNAPRGALNLCNAGAASFNGPVTLLADAGLYADNASSVLTMGGPIQGAANLTIMPGAGTVILASSNAYCGRTMVQGQLKLTGGDDRLPRSTALWLADRETAGLHVNGQNQVIGSLSGGGSAGGYVALDGGTLTIDQAQGGGYNGVISGSGHLVKTNSGTLALYGANTFTGTTTVQAGRLGVNGFLGGAAITVTGGELCGTGIISAPVTIKAGGTLSPGLLGPSAGTLSISNSLMLSLGSLTRVRIDILDGTSDQVNGLTGITYGGTLMLTNLDTSKVRTIGQSFRLFSGARGSGSFQRITPAPPTGMAWSFDPSTGVLKAVAPPTLNFVRKGSNALQVSWLGAGFHLEAQTNSLAVGLSTNWSDYPGGTLSPVLVPIPPANRDLFLRLATP